MKILTFDIEDWFHILDNPATASPDTWGKFESRIRGNMEKIFRLLEDNKTPATFFCLGWVAQHYPDVIRDIDAAGFEVATHSDTHQLAYTQSEKEFRNDLQRSIRSLQDVTGKPIRAYRAPGFSIKAENAWALDVLIEEGIEVDCSIFPAARAHGGFESYGVAKPSIIQTNKGQLKEFPINLGNVLMSKNAIFSGGGYFRLYPHAMLKNLFGKSPYVMTYFHPRDFDPDQPLVPGLSLVRRFKSYYGLGRCLPKLNRLLKEFEFIDLKTAIRQVDWDNTPVRQLNK